jgi:RecJ-like exonuclease
VFFVDRIFYLTYFLSLSGIFLLAYFSPYLVPPVSDLSDVDVFSIGKSVRVYGSVTEVHIFTGGGVSFLLSGGNSSIRVYMPPYVGVSCASRLRDGVRAEIIGVVSQYRGAHQLVVERVEDIIIK